MILRTYPSLASVPFAPWADFAALQRAFDRLQDSFSEVAELPFEAVETEEGAQLSFEVPGVEAKNVKVEVEARSVSVSVERPSPERPAGANVLRAERAYGATSRTLELPFVVDRDAVKAELKNGILTLTLSRAVEDRPRRIEVRHG